MDTRKNISPSKRGLIKTHSRSPTKHTPKNSSTSDARTTRSTRLQSLPSKLPQGASPRKAVSWTSPLDLKRPTEPVPKTPILKAISPNATPSKRAKKTEKQISNTSKRSGTSRDTGINTPRSSQNRVVSQYSLRSHTPTADRVIATVGQVLKSPSKKPIASPKKSAQAGRRKTKTLDLASTVPKYTAPRRKKPLQASETSGNISTTKKESVMGRDVDDVAMEKGWADDGGQGWFLPSYSRLVSWAFRSKV